MSSINYGILTLSGSPVSYIELLTAAETKEYLKIDDPSPADADFDLEIDMMIQAAREEAELLQGRDLVAKQWDLTLDEFATNRPYLEGDQIELRDPLDSVDSITYKNSSGVTTTLVLNTDYIVDAKRFLVQPPYGGTWPSFTAWPTSAVTVRFTSGGTAPPYLQILKIGMLVLIECWFTGKLQAGEISPGIARLLQYGRKDWAH